ncbi:MAG: hypothetical protein KJ571_10595 [Bacteroidetes bacterium]|nr:hypothetical protein [Bacteroidota bacterium]
MIKPVKNKNIFSGWRKLSLQKAAKYTIVVTGSFIFLVILIFIFFHNPIINIFIKDRITESYNKANLEYTLKLGDMNYNIWKNSLSSDSVSLKSADSSIIYKAASITIGGIGWFKVLLQMDLRMNNLTSSVINAQDIVINFPKSKNELHLNTLYVSIYDSTITADSIKYYSLIDDEQYFAESLFRQTRFYLNIPKIKAVGMDCISLLEGSVYKLKNISIYNMSADILVNMDKPYDISLAKPLMPNELFANFKKTVNIDSLKIINAQLKYSERYAVKAVPGVITFDKVNVLGSGINNYSERTDTAAIYAEGIFMNSAEMKLFMKIPLTSKEFSFQYNGSLSSMDATGLNKFIVPAEFHHINSGFINSASFNINVNSGNAGGNLRVAYKDLSISILNKKTGSQDGIFDRITSLIGEIFVIRGTNLPDKNGKMEIGEVKYTRNRDDYFLQFVWFALRSGVADVVGF